MELAGLKRERASGASRPSRRLLRITAIRAPVPDRDLSPHDVAWAGRAPSRPGRPQSERAVAGAPVRPPEKATLTPRARGLLVALPQVDRAPRLWVLVLAQFADGALLDGVGSVAPLAWWTTRSDCYSSANSRPPASYPQRRFYVHVPGAWRPRGCYWPPHTLRAQNATVADLEQERPRGRARTRWPSGPGLRVARRHAPEGGVFGPRRRSRGGDVVRLKVRRAPAAAIPHGEARHCSGEQEYQQGEH